MPGLPVQPTRTRRHTERMHPPRNAVVHPGGTGDSPRTITRRETTLMAILLAGEAIALYGHTGPRRRSSVSDNSAKPIAAQVVGEGHRAFVRLGDRGLGLAFLA